MTSSSAAQKAGVAASPQRVPFMEALRFWLKLGFISFGGPAGQIAIMHQELVEQKQWISERQFLRALNFCMLLPGPEAQQLATYMGWRLHGIAGGVVAGGLFVLPAVFILLLLSWLAASYSEVPAISGLFYGIQAVVLAIVLEAIIRIGKRALYHPLLILFAVGALLALQVPGFSFPLVIAAAALGGLLLYRWKPDIIHAPSAEPEDSLSPEEQPPLPSLRRNVLLLGVFVLLWTVPVGLLLAWRGADDVLVQQAIFFTEAAFITFGGAYAVLTYIADVAVNQYEWLTTSEMVRGLGLAESTPGPLIMVTQYVGFMGAWKFHGEFPPTLYGTFGALVTTYVTFLPCFMFIFLGAPYIEFLARQERLQAALTGVTAAVVGVIANLALFFGSSVLFPDDGPLDVFALVLAVVAFLLLRLLHLQIYWVVPLGAVVGMLWILLIQG
jgi:chromate transporter